MVNRTGTEIKKNIKSNCIYRCNQIAKISKNYGAEVPFLRPKKYAQDYSTTESVLIHAVKKLGLET